MLNWPRWAHYVLALVPSLFLGLVTVGPDVRAIMLPTALIQSLVYVLVCEMFVALFKQHFEARGAKKLQRSLSDGKPKRIDL